MHFSRLELGQVVGPCELDTELSGYRFGQSGIQFPVSTRGFCLLQNIQTSSGAHPAPYSLGNGVFFGVMQPGCEVTFLPPSSVVKNEWTCTFTPPIMPS